MQDEENIIFPLSIIGYLTEELSAVHTHWPYSFHLDGFHTLFPIHPRPSFNQGLIIFLNEGAS